MIAQRSFSDPQFQTAFKTHFSELGITVQDWDSLFQEMNNEGNNRACVRTCADGGIIGFILFQPTKFTNWFIEETLGFIQEFWISKTHQNTGHGAALLRRAEDYFKEHCIYTSILTSDTPERFYLKHGYQKATGCKAKNQDEVFIRHLIRLKPQNSN
jgi:GNAT superfamily N-acetyltransferase